MSEASSTRGRLLVAAPVLEDPNFQRAVVLMLEHSAGGALGVVLDRSTATTVEEVLEQWALLASPPSLVHSGGPVEPGAVVAVARVTDGHGNLAAAEVVGRLVVLDLRQPCDDVVGHVDGLRLFAGYSGWGPGQLEQELAEGAWIVVQAVDDDPFTDDPDNLWRSVLHRQGGRLAAMAERIPDDLSLN